MDAPPAWRLQGAPHTLHTPRLLLESPRAEHAPAFADGVAASMPALGFVRWGLKPRDLAWARRFCEDDARSFAAGEDLAYHVFLRGAEGAADTRGAWVGRIDVHSIDSDAARGEIGYVGHLQRSGQGLMREAVLAVIDLCFALGFQRIEAMSDARNTRALRFARSLGMQHEGLLRRHERDVHGHWCDMDLFAVLNPRP